MSLGLPELLIILVVVMLLFGASRLPKLARSMGRSAKEFKEGLAEGATDEDGELPGDAGQTSDKYEKGEKSKAEKKKT